MPIRWRLGPALQYSRRPKPSPCQTLQGRASQMTWILCGLRPHTKRLTRANHLAHVKWTHYSPSGLMGFKTQGLIFVTCLRVFCTGETSLNGMHCSLTHCRQTGLTTLHSTRPSSRRHRGGTHGRCDLPGLLGLAMWQKMSRNAPHLPSPCCMLAFWYLAQDRA